MVSKNILSIVSSYCIEADPNNEFIISHDENTRINQINTSLKTLSSPGQIVQDSNGNNVQKIGLEIASEEWGTCLKSINSICKMEAKGCNQYINDSLSTCTANQSGDKCDCLYSRLRACEATNDIKSMQQNLIASESLKDFYKKLNEDKNHVGIAVSNIDAYSPGTKGRGNIDDLTTITSAEINKFDTVKKDKEEQMQKDFECQKKLAQSQGKLPQDDECNIEQANLEIGLSAFETKLHEDRLQNMTKAELAEYLKQSGYEEKEIQKMLQQEAAVKKQIVDEYKNMRISLIDSLNEKIKSKTAAIPSSQTANTGPNATTSNNPQNNQQQIQNEAKKQTELTTALTHYNNIVTSLLATVSDDANDKTKSKTELNTYPMQLELKSHGYEGNGRSVSGNPTNASPPKSSNTIGYSKSDIENLQKNSSQKGYLKDNSGNKDDDSSTGAKTINSTTINCNIFKRGITVDSSGKEVDCSSL